MQAKKIALSRIEYLLDQAATAKKDLANRYAKLARILQMKSRVRMPRKLNMRICKNCDAYLSSKNSIIRTKKKMLLIYCKDCGHIRRIPIK